MADVNLFVFYIPGKIKKIDLTLMKAAIWTAYGPPEVFQLREIEKPRPKENEVLIRVQFATVTLGDCELRKFDFMPWLRVPMRLFMGVFKPRLKSLGQEFSGVIEEVGNKVTKYKKGDFVFGPTDMRMGAYAEYKCLKGNHAMALRPPGISSEDAATVAVGGINGLHFLRKAKVKAGDHVLINGAGGSIGTYAVQIAKLWGAEVTAVDSDIKLDTLKSIGADHVIDYRKQNFTETGSKYDVIIDVVGRSDYEKCIACLKPNGRYMLGNPTFSGMVKSLFTKKEGKKVLVELAAYKPEYFEYLIEVLSGKKIKPVIDKRFSLEQIVEAHHYVDKGLKVGNVIININPEG
jgi:NADPH:quinone reductase-like Zn-dependent oxidoreductase